MVIMMDFFAVPQQQKEKLTSWTKAQGGKACSHVALKEQTEILASLLGFGRTNQLGFFKSEMWPLEQSY